ncbi:RNA ligase [Nonomuraea dietziae]|uniref:RNA ligase n=1 Tax=Nonomuraea dietziae TaxID=65515 RepID=UPI0033FA4FAD
MTTTPKLHLVDLFHPRDLQTALDDGYVRLQHHPHLPLTIINYAEKTQYEKAWTQVTLACRGLIIDGHGWVIARPFPKFFNYAELSQPLPLDANVKVYDKLDGSLGILYPTSEGRYAIATRGSFTSEQARHATQVWNDRYADKMTPEADHTYLFEIIYPGNRIVCDYGALDDLVLLGAIDNTTGTYVGPEALHWPGPKTAVFGYRTLGEALFAPPRPGAEGFVVHLPDHDLVVKLKQAEYVALHKAVTGMNARVLWELLGQGKGFADICEPLPDELHAWVITTGNGLLDQLAAALRTVSDTHEKVVEALPGGWTRRDYALAVAESPLRPWLFNVLDGKDPSPGIWKSLRPTTDDRPVAYTEDAA